jgi:hypothetical protein
MYVKRGDGEYFFGAPRKWGKVQEDISHWFPFRRMPTLALSGMLVGRKGSEGEGGRKKSESAL